MRFFVYLGNLLSACDQNEANVNLDYHSVALFFNQPEVVLSVLRNVADFDLNLCCTDSLQDLCLCFTEIHQYWWNRLVETGRRTTTLVHLGPPNISVCGAGRPRSILLEELLENLRKSRQLLGNKALQNPSILFNEQLLLNLAFPNCHTCCNLCLGGEWKFSAKSTPACFVVAFRMVDMWCRFAFGVHCYPFISAS